MLKSYFPGKEGLLLQSWGKRAPCALDCSHLERTLHHAVLRVGSRFHRLSLFLSFFLYCCLSTKQTSKQNITRDIGTKNKPTVTRGEVGGDNEEAGKGEGFAGTSIKVVAVVSLTVFK